MTNLEQRAEARKNMHGVRETRPFPDSSPIDLIQKRDATTGALQPTFRGLVSATGDEFGYEITDAYGTFREVMQPSCWRKTIQDTAKNPASDCVFVFGHDHSQIPYARTSSGTLRLWEVMPPKQPRGTQVPAGATWNANEEPPRQGLWCEATLDGTREDVRALLSAISRGDVFSMSVGMTVHRQTWDDDYKNRVISEASLAWGDVSAVGHAANPGTVGQVSVRCREVTPRAYRRAAQASPPAEIAVMIARAREDEARTLAKRGRR